MPYTYVSYSVASPNSAVVVLLVERQSITKTIIPGRNTALVTVEISPDCRY